MNPFLYWTLLAMSCGYALVRGRADERIAAAVCIIASLVSVLVLSPMGVRYTLIEPGELTVDLVVLMIFVGIALRSDRFWPLWVAGLQLTTTMAHALKAVDLALIPAAYGAAERFWSYPILLIIAIGTARHQRRLRSDRARLHPA